MKHPIQPLLQDEDGVTRFKSNAIVRFLLDSGPFDMNSLAVRDFSQEDREQFAQLIGYSLSGFGDLSYVTDDTFNAAEKMAEGQSEEEARIQALESTLEQAREHGRRLAATLFRIHPEDLET